MSRPWNLFGQLLAGVFRAGATGPAAKRRANYRPAVEGMEDRCLLSGDLVVNRGTVLATIPEPDPNFASRVTGGREVTLTTPIAADSVDIPVTLKPVKDSHQVEVVLDKPLPVKYLGLFEGSLTIRGHYTNSSDQRVESSDRTNIHGEISSGDLVQELAPLSEPAGHPGKPKPGKPKPGKPKPRHPRRGHVRRPGQGVGQLQGGGVTGLQGALGGGGGAFLGGGGTVFGSGFGGVPLTNLGGGGFA
jgi:hypothetical protein